MNIILGLFGYFPPYQSNQGLVLPGSKAKHIIKATLGSVHYRNEVSE